MINKSLILQHPREFIDGFSSYYPISEKLLHKYEDVWNWRLLSKSTSIKWTLDLIDRFTNNWNWGYLGLSTNESIDWSADMLQQFENKLSWYHLGWQEQIINNPELFHLCTPHWDEWRQRHLFKDYRFMPNMQRGATWAETVFENWSTLNWSHFSAYSGFPWSETFIRRNQDKLDWKELSGNKALPWSVAFIREHMDRWHWKNLSYAIPTDRSLFATFQDQLDWFSISIRSARTWDIDLLIEFQNQLHWVWPEYNEGGEIVFIGGLFNNSSVQWTPKLYNACNDTIARQFNQLLIDFADVLNESNTVVLEANENWSVWLDATNWTKEFLQMMIELESHTNNIKYIYWKSFAHHFNQWQSLDEGLIKYCLKEIDHLTLTANIDFPWHEFPELLQTLDNLTDQEHGFSAWSQLSANAGLKLSFDLIEKNKEKWDWKALSANPSLTVELVRKFEDRWNWRVILSNRNIAADLIIQYPQYWREYWIENKKPPFGSRDHFLKVLGIDETQSSFDTLAEAQLDEIIREFLDQPDDFFKKAFDAALAAGDFSELVPIVTHDRFLPLILTNESEIISKKWPLTFFEQLAQKGFRMIQKGDFATAITIFKILLQIELSSGKIQDLSPFCNALYVVQSDNNGMPINQSLNTFFLEKCLPHAPSNPAIYFNAACLYVEMRDLDRAYECVRLAKEHKYQDYDWMIGEIKNSRIFDDFVRDERFKTL